jgi:hypothetical protein
MHLCVFIFIINSYEFESTDTIKIILLMLFRDASRFVEFCCFYGLVEGVDSLTLVGKAFKNYLSKTNLSNDYSNLDSGSNNDSNRNISKNNKSQNDRFENVLPLTPIR